MIDASVHGIHFCSNPYMKSFVRRNAELARLVKAACFDPVRVDKITTKVRDSHFSKLDLFTRVLVSMNILPPEVKGFSDVDSSKIYNIDEIGVDTTKRSRIKVSCMAKKQKTQCVLYCGTFEGDSKMARHMSIVLYSRADGAYCYPDDDENNYDEHNAIPPYVIHANKSK
eukprot:10668712-Ditylum_brightwellii.AAC.1